MMRRLLAIAALAAPAAILTACGERNDSRAAAADSAIVVFNAGSLARPMRAALDSFAARRGLRVEQENAGSLETARKLTELHHVPDVVALADYEVFPQLLIPSQTTWFAEFARNRMVLAYTDRSRFASEIGGANWFEILVRPGVETGRADPNRDPNGYRTLLVLQLAERFYGAPRLAARLFAAMPVRNMRSNEADLVGLLQAGELDYIWSYESLAQAAALRYVALPAEIDLSSPEKASIYALASVRVNGATPGDSITFRGTPILYALSIPARAPHRARAESFVRWLLSADGVRVLRANKLDA
ncbi:MAG: extracellular solute-binding protein, partial [Gemmatimonadaceae bacterium]